MKKMFVLLFIVLCSPVMAEQLYIQPTAEFAYGISDDVYKYAPGYTINPGVGAGFTLGYQINNVIAVEASAECLYWISDVPSNIDVTMYYFPVYCGINYHVTDVIGIISGLGFSYSYREVTIDDYTGDETSTDFSCFAGIEFLFSNVSVRPMYVYGKMDGREAHYFEMSTGYRFSF